MSRLTTHVLDTVRGAGADGLKVSLRRPEVIGAPIAHVALDAGGRGILSESLAPGVYELLFEVGAYHRAVGLPVASPPFLEEVPIRFRVAANGGHYHVPLILSLYGYSTYRGG